MRRHLRRFLTVTDEQRRRLYFRYYDPRVLRVFLPACDGSQLQQLFGPCHAYMLENERGTELVRYSQARPGTLRIQTSPLSQ